MTLVESEPMIKIKCAIKGCFHMPYVGNHPGIGLLAVFMFMTTVLTGQALYKGLPVFISLFIFTIMSLLWLGILFSSSYSRFEISARMTRQFKLQQLALSLAELLNKKGTVAIKILVQNRTIEHNLSHPDVSKHDIDALIKEALTFEGCFPTTHTHLGFVETKGGHTHHDMLRLMADVFVHKKWKKAKDPNA